MHKVDKQWCIITVIKRVKSSLKQMGLQLQPSVNVFLKRICGYGYGYRLSMA